MLRGSSNSAGSPDDADAGHIMAMLLLKGWSNSAGSPNVPDTGHPDAIPLPHDQQWSNNVM